MCIMDGADFEPYWMTNRCDLILDERESAEFWVELLHVGFCLDLPPLPRMLMRTTPVFPSWVTQRSSALPSPRSGRTSRPRS